jgi:hypothetical protein
VRLVFQLVGTLLLVAWVMHFLPWIIAAAAIAWAVWYGVKVYRASVAAAEADRRRLAEIAARADQQHEVDDGRR